MVEFLKTDVDNSWLDIVRRSDGFIVASFPAERRHLVYRVNGVVSIRPLLPDEETWIGPYISRHFLSLYPLLVRRRRYSRG
ncbi:hypothetical protein RZO85_12285, partial [Raoultella ornithinolytica]|uniref:hypothetical protein n=1 Tax=Raoultella ornithinolytica TaxID=54291 RepID=UPI00292C1B58